MGPGACHPAGFFAIIRYQIFTWRRKKACKWLQMSPVLKPTKAYVSNLEVRDQQEIRIGSSKGEVLDFTHAKKSLFSNHFIK